MCSYYLWWQGERECTLIMYLFLLTIASWRCSRPLSIGLALPCLCSPQDIAFVALIVGNGVKSGRLEPNCTISWAIQTATVNHYTENMSDIA